MGCSDSVGVGGWDAFGLLGSDDQNYAKQGIGAYNAYYHPMVSSAKQESDALFQSAHGQLQEGLSGLTKGYTDARANMSDLRRVGAQSIFDAQTRADAQRNQSRTTSGLSTLSGGTSARATQMALADLDTQLMQLYAGLDIGQASAEAGARSNIASLFQNQAGATQGFLGQQLGAVANVPIQQQPQNSILDLIGPLMFAAAI